MNLSLREKILVAFVIVFVYIYMYMNLYSYGIIKKINLCKNDIKDIKYKIVKLNNLEEKDSNKSLIENAYNKANEEVPQDEDTEEFLYYIESFKDDKIKINSIDLQKPQNAAKDINLYKITVKIEANGLYEDIINFINRIEKGQRYVYAESLKVSGCNGKIVNANITMNTYCMIVK